MNQPSTNGNANSEPSKQSPNKKLSSKLVSLESEYMVTMKLYEQAYKNYAATLKDSISAVQEDPCAKYSSNSVGVSQDCYNKIWKDAGCTQPASNVTTGWLSTQTLDTMKSDSNLWATLDDDDHKIGCYGSTSGKSSTSANEDASNLSSINGYTFWGTTALNSVEATSETDCKNACANDSKCTGATFNANKQLCWTRSGAGDIAAGETDDYAIVPKLMEQAYILKQLNAKLTKLNVEILSEMQTSFGTTNYSEEGDSKEGDSIKGSDKNGPMGQYRYLFKPSEASMRMKQLVDDKAEIDKAISELDTSSTLNSEFEDSKLYVKQKNVYYILMFIIMMILLCVVLQNSTFSKVAAVIIIVAIILLFSKSLS